VDLSTFLEKKIKHKTGKIIDTSGKVLGEHKGVFYYTIGQRKGLDIG
jgi:tRNA-specific 2-thiouridylase